MRSTVTWVWFRRPHSLAAVSNELSSSGNKCVHLAILSVVGVVKVRPGKRKRGPTTAVAVARRRKSRREDEVFAVVLIRGTLLVLHARNSSRHTRKRKRTPSWVGQPGVAGDKRNRLVPQFRIQGL